MIYNIVLASGVQHSDSVFLHICNFCKSEYMSYPFYIYLITISIKKLLVSALVTQFFSLWTVNPSPIPSLSCVIACIFLLIFRVLWVSSDKYLVGIRENDNMPDFCPLS